MAKGEDLPQTIQKPSPQYTHKPSTAESNRPPRPRSQLPLPPPPVRARETDTQVKGQLDACLLLTAAAASISKMRQVRPPLVGTVRARVLPRPRPSRQNIATNDACGKLQGSRTQVVTAGAIAGLISRFCIAPLDVLKIRLQLQIHSLRSPHSPHRRIHLSTLSTLRTILREEGIRGLWKGNVPAELLYLTYGGLQFTSYRSVSQLLSHVPAPYTLPRPAESFISGALAGALATTATYPLDLLRTRFAAQGTGTHKVYLSLSSGIRSIARTEGPRGFFQGLGAGVVGIVPYMGLFFSTYEMVRQPLSSLSLPFSSSDALSGILASVFAKTGVYPLDTIRKRLQVQGPARAKFGRGDLPLYKGIAGTAATIWRAEGVRGLYRGLGVSLVKAAPTSAITMWTYERVLGILVEMERKASKREEAAG
ncbi:MAG: mitochondrial thiamine pyrophosphate transporter [Sarea resinae]|nr:MAG: mitochondrial thiamine pyrophosphate transporter [Sarea resinae]